MAENTTSDHDMSELYQKAMQQIMDIFVTPEVTRRQENGELPRPLDLRAAQIIFYINGRKPEVRINSEVKAVGKVKLKPGVSKNPGDPVYENDLEGVAEITLTENDDPNCGHATLLRLGDMWLLAFDFIYNKALAKKHIDDAKQFIQAAEFLFSQKYWNAFVDNLFSAAELLAKAILLTFWSDPKFQQKATHEAIHSRYNRFAHLGNVDPHHAETFNKLSRLRYPARYSRDYFSLSESEAEELLERIKGMLQETSRMTKASQE